MRSDEADLHVADGDDVAAPELTAAAELDAAADGDDALGEQRPDVGAGVDEAGQLEQMAQPDAVVADGHLSDLAHATSLPQAPGRFSATPSAGEVR